MIKLEQKYTALLGDVQRRAIGGGVPAAMGQLRLCFELLGLASAIDGDCATRLGRHGLSEGKFVLLFLLRDAPKGLSPHELAERAGVTRGTITGLLDGLERDGFLARHADQLDRRKLLVRLSAKGEAAAATLVDEHAQWIASLFADFTQQEMQLLSSLLEKAWRKTDSGDTQGAP
ncbi:MarR family transcriptional regulator [Janthinobacterium violaceinigrum]|uniref:MarR family transcriptional regulator n=1 Tax=Janthinobacterium violaceinigrum TaxID=2654252 RepID=A0A6I1IBS8_9BURK|nr:MarR family transcriptional regulator [Janthinobacterium violaceinigrum]KAB8064678.1 MarR family transcriptional regulator [Janthinobacterium violaceinigrum]